MFQAIQTTYDGHKFRSRLEARWALFFNFVGVRWEYEPEGFALEHKGKAFQYLPDFRLTSLGCWFEVKPSFNSFDDEQIKLIARDCYSLAQATEMPVHVAFGALRDVEVMYMPARAEFGEGYEVFWGRCAECLAWSLGLYEPEMRSCCGETCGLIGYEQMRGTLLDAHAYRFWEPRQ